MNGDLRTVSLELQRYVLERFESGGELAGPDPIGRIHWRITRFLRGLLPIGFAEDRHIFYQGIAYWVLANFQIAEKGWSPQGHEIAVRAADYIVRTQRDDGGWRYPDLLFRRGKTATVEGGWAAIALTRAHRATGEARYLESAQRWHRYMLETIGFSWADDMACVNYYDTPVGMIPNNATIALWLNAELAVLTGDAQYLETSAPQLRFLTRTQLESGELPYRWPDRTHLYCYQYNSFEYLDLVEVQALAPDPALRDLLVRLAGYLCTGVRENGGAKRDCFDDQPEVNYWTLALATALRRATREGHADAGELADRALERVLHRRRSDGSFWFSTGEYGFVPDRRRYPRYLSMMLQHLPQHADPA